jgi:D-sedoheptulose 7-phosphate isomerase
VSNDYSYPEVFEKPIAMFADPSDLLIAISSSGRSPNILKAAEKAKALGCRVVTMSGFLPENPLRQAGHLNFYVPSSSYGMVEIAHLTLCHYITDHFVSCAAKASTK